MLSELLFCVEKFLIAYVYYENHQCLYLFDVFLQIESYNVIIKKTFNSRFLGYWSNNNMIAFDKIYFGCADANIEAERNPKVFNKVFFDPHRYIEELINGDRYILRGRKGDGKTAYSAQIKLVGDDYNVHVCQKSLDSFNNTIFSKIKTYDDLGGNPYISFWKCIILIECVGMIFSLEPNIQKREFTEIVDALNSQGLLEADNSISYTISKFVDSNSTLKIKDIFQHSKNYTKETELRGAEQIYKAIKESIQSVYLHKKFLMIIDGLDDILNSTEFKAEIITGLIRAVNEINRSFKKTTLSIKILILIRDDILNICRDTNLSKIILDSGIRLSWSFRNDPLDSDLIKLVEKRVDDISGYEGSFSLMWEEIFPQQLSTRNSLEYVLENIIYRPRDILQFFLEVQKEYIPGKKITEEKVENALYSYSNEYFITAMLDELTGFFPNDVVTMLPNVLTKMGVQYFYLSDFENECFKYPVFNNVVPRLILEKLFAAGYIGQNRPRAKMDYTVFSYRNQHEKFDEDHECIVHRGLMRALTI